MILQGEAPPGAALDAALPALRADLRLNGEAADGELGRCLRVAAELCEAHTGLALIEREVVEAIGGALPHAGGGARWTALRFRPVRAITAVASAEGAALDAGDYAVDIGADGTGLVRAPGAMRVTYRAGVAADWAGVPDTLALGLVRLAGHLWSVRDGGGGKPPAAVAALWAPWRRMGLGFVEAPRSRLLETYGGVA